MLRKEVMLSIYRRRYNKLFKYVTTAKSAVSTGRQKAPPFNRTLCVKNSRESMSLIIIAVLLVVPFFTLQANRKLFNSNLKNISISAISAVFVYISILLYVVYIENKLNVELDIFDLNKDGFFSAHEITPEQEKAMHRVTSDTARNLAPFTGAIFSVVYFLGIWLFFSLTSRVSKWYANKNT
jgi:hypothetical protein